VETLPAARSAVATSGAVRIRLLGELQVRRAGREVALPASKRTRALLGFLVASGSAQSRHALCDLLWDGPDDPRAELRWCLSKLRPVVDDPAAPRIAADRERVAFVPHGATTDLAELQVLLGAGIPAATVPVLEEAAALLAGEFLDGLELPACYRYHQWCMAERERHGALRLKVIAALVERLAADPERALTYSRALIAADPSSEAAHAELVRILVTLGRQRDAQQHCQQTETMFRRDFGVVPTGALRDAERRLRDELQQRARAGRGEGATARPQSAGDPEASPPPGSGSGSGSGPPGSGSGSGSGSRSGSGPEPGPGPESRQGWPQGLAPEPVAAAGGTDTTLVGRAAEQRVIAAALAALERPQPGNLLLFVGEPGIGKTRLLDALAEQARAGGCRVLQARCFEAEMMRPYGGWIDALRGLPPELVPDAIGRDLGPLLSQTGADQGEAGDRARLFAASIALVNHLATTQPLVLILDDLQWLDEGAAALLHYLVRGAGPTARVLVAGAARAGEIDDNPWARRVAQSLARDRRVHRCVLGPLDSGEIAQLLARAAPSADAASVHRRSGGNPLLALAVGNAGTGGGADAAVSWQALIADQVQRLDEPTRELLIWTAAMGREFHLETLCAAMGAAETDLLMQLERLERQGLLKPTTQGRYDFAHDLVREAVYRQISQPRRRAIHRRIARVLVATAAADPSLYGELAHHASQADDAALTVQACLATGEHCLRVFANPQALDAASSGLAMLQRLPAAAERVIAQIALLRLRIVAGLGLRSTRLPEVAEALRQAITVAESMGLHSAAASGLHMLSWLTQQANDPASTRTATLRAERMSRTADAATRCQQLANSGRCLLEVEADIPQARALVDAAAGMAEQMNLHVIELEWGRGLIARWDGDLDAAQRCLRAAVDLARLREDRWREFECLVWLATIEFERGRLEAVDLLCRDVSAVAARMGDVDVPICGALCALAAALQWPARLDDAALQHSLGALRARDDKTHLAYVLNHLAALELDAGRLDRAHAAATEALAAARALGRGNEIAIALALLAGVADARGLVQPTTDRSMPWPPWSCAEAGSEANPKPGAEVEADATATPRSARARAFLQRAAPSRWSTVAVQA
jgi:DNA-binding SARP family transcriptional activator/tetratricopeptide (TPR) repeat protein